MATKTTSRDRLRQLLSLFAGGDSVLIAINADPDAIASAMALKRLLWRKVAGVTVASVNVIRRPDNLAMLRLLGVKLAPLANVAVERFQRVALLDSQPSHHEAFQKLPLDVIIDHHPLSGAQARFVDIRPRYGATASILTEYLRAARIKPSSKLATALFLGIKTDTSDFERETQIEDVVAFQFLFRHANIPLARRIEKTDLTFRFLKYFQRAIADRRLVRGKVFAHLGPVVSADVCVLIAEFFMRVATVNWSIVSGICDRKLVVVFRNDGIRRKAGLVAREAFAQLGSAGGHKTMARAEIPLAGLHEVVDHRQDRKVLNWIVQRVTRRAEAS